MKVTSKNYDGKLYIKLGSKHIPLEQTIEYFEKIEKENEQLKQSNWELLMKIEKKKNCGNCNGIRDGIRDEKCKQCFKYKDFRYWELAE